MSRRAAPRGAAAGVLAASIVAAAGLARAGMADTVPQGVVLVDTDFLSTKVDRRFDSDGDVVNINENVERYAPTGEFQGQILVPGTHEVEALLSRVVLGVTDQITVGVIVPYFFRQETKLNLGWESGDFIPEFNREMSEDDFWEWAGGLGQPKPKDWRGTDRLGDVILAALVNLAREPWTQITFLGFGSTFTADDAPPEQLGSVGTSGFDFITNGDIGLHLLSDWRVPDRGWLSQLTLNAEAFYEFYLPREFRTPAGRIHPLILNEAAYVGPTYEVERGDTWGGSLGLTWDAYGGPTEPSWLTEKNPGLQERLPAVLSASFLYTSFHAFDTDYTSRSEIWDAEKEHDNRELYKNNLKFGARLSFIRYGIPVDLTGGYMNQTWLPGKNFRPADGWSVGLRLYYSVFINPIDLIFGE